MSNFQSSRSATSKLFGSLLTATVTALATKEVSLPAAEPAAALTQKAATQSMRKEAFSIPHQDGKGTAIKLNSVNANAVIFQKAYDVGFRMTHNGQDQITITGPKGNLTTITNNPVGPKEFWPALRDPRRDQLLCDYFVRALRHEEQFSQAVATAGVVNHGIPNKIFAEATKLGYEITKTERGDGFYIFKNHRKVKTVVLGPINPNSIAGKTQLTAELCKILNKELGKSSAETTGAPVTLDTSTQAALVVYPDSVHYGVFNRSVDNGIKIAVTSLQTATISNKGEIIATVSIPLGFAYQAIWELEIGLTLRDIFAAKK